MNRGTVPCIDCGKEIDQRWDFREITGWEKRRAGGGTNAVKERRETGRWMCRGCWDERHVAAGTLF